MSHTKDIQAIMMSQMNKILGPSWNKASTDLRTIILLGLEYKENIKKEQKFEITRVAKHYLRRSMKRRDM